MPRLPYLAGAPQQRRVTDVFAGYDHHLRIADGAFYDTENLTTAAYPLLSSRPKRGVISGVGTRSFSGLRAILAKDALCWVEGGTLYVNGAATALTGLQTQTETQLVSMGAYICVFPDKKYYNTMDPSDYGSMEASWTYAGAVNYRMCRADGTVYTNVDKGTDAPENPDNGDVWIDTTDGDTAKVYSAALENWTALETVYTRVDFTTQGQLGAAFSAYDGVEISGLRFDGLNGSKILYAVGGRAASEGVTAENDYVVLIGIQEEAFTENDAAVTIRRKVPDMDFVCEAQNRLWGCFYGNDGTQNLNEIYCCALGDFKNWSQYLGLSTDSWRAGVGSDGGWTGCANYMGSPTFFKENRIHPVSVSPEGAHRIGDLPARGVQQGSHKSLAVVGETLYYKTRSGVVAWQGGMPADVGAALGDVPYFEAAAGVFGRRYYISMKDGANQWNLFCYDAARGLWMREDSLHAEGFTQWGDELYARVGNTIVALNGTAGTLEGAIRWRAETGLMAYEASEKGRGLRPVRYVSRFGFRLRMERGAWVRLYIEYDSSGVWEFSGEVRVRNLDSFTVPVRPRRCDHLRLKLEGEGEVKIFSMARVLERGSDA